MIAHDLDALEAAANAATPGPWLTGEDWPGNGRRYIVEAKSQSVASTRTWNNDNTEADARYIALADPQTTLALVARVRALEAENATIKALRDADPELSRAAALLRAVEAIGDGANYVLINQGGWEICGRNRGEYGSGPTLADALIALAVQIGGHR